MHGVSMKFKKNEYFICVFLQQTLSLHCANGEQVKTIVRSKLLPIKEIILDFIATVIKVDLD